MKEVALWSAEEVERWLAQEGLQEYCSPSCRIGGQQLLNLAPSDFQRPPLSLMSSDGGRQLLERVETLRIEGHMEAHKNGHAKANGHANGHANGYANGYANGPNGFRPDMVRIAVPEPDRPNYPSEWRKTGVSFAYALCCLITTTIVIAVVHERVPPKEKSPPLPDKFFDVFDRVEWAFSICEINGMLLMGLWLLQWGLLKYRAIVGRRFFFIMGTLYLYRCVTMYVTTLPVPGLHFRCSPKIFGDWEAQMRRIVKMLAGGGLSITGSHSMCGDYLYSGHTVMLTLTYLFIKEYSPKRFWWYHWACWTLSAVGIFCILLAHDHYTVDVVVAYFITTRLFWWYHTLANQKVLKERSQANPVSRVWWYRLFLYFEENVHGIVPRNIQLPFSWRALAMDRLGYARVDTSE